MRLLPALLLLALPVQAQDMTFDITPTLTCVDVAPDTIAAKMCIGEAASACMEQDMGFTTVGMGFCLDQELSYWDGVLNESYQKLRAALIVSDQTLPASLPSQANSLRDMQRAWIAFRDTKCSFEASLMQGGTAGSTVFLSCAMQLTGEQALFLQTTADNEW